MHPAPATGKPLSQGALLATGCGTAIASICSVGLFQIERLVGGLWSLLSVLCAGALCLGLARILARLATVLPSGAGVLAYLSRGLGRAPGLCLGLPYLLLTLFLIGAEALIVGLLVGRPTGLPTAVGAIAYLGGTFLFCHSGARLGYRAQAVATWSLVAGLVLLSLLSIAQAAAQGALAARLLPPAPDPARFVSAVGQGLFLFMGFELVTSQAEAAQPGDIAAALRRSVLVLVAFYGAVSLGFSCLDRAALVGADAALVPQLAMAEHAGGVVAVLLIVGLSLLASFTSFNGALLAISRLVQALAAQGVLPRSLALRDGRTLVPRRALVVLLGLSLLATVAVSALHLVSASILAAAAAAALVYGALAVVRRRPPFAMPDRSSRSLGGAWTLLLATALPFLLLALGVVADAGSHRPATLALLGLAYAAGLAAARRAGTATTARRS